MGSQGGPCPGHLRARNCLRHDERAKRRHLPDQTCFDHSEVQLSCGSWSRQEGSHLALNSRANDAIHFGCHTELLTLTSAMSWKGELSLVSRPLSAAAYHWPITLRSKLREKALGPKRQVEKRKGGQLGGTRGVVRFPAGIPLAQRH